MKSRDGVEGRRTGDPFYVAELIRTLKQPATPFPTRRKATQMFLAGEAREHLIEIVFGNGIQHPKLHSEGARPSFRVPRLWRGYGAGGIDEERDRFGGGNEVVPGAPCGTRARVRPPWLSATLGSSAERFPVAANCLWLT